MYDIQNVKFLIKLSIYFDYILKYVVKLTEKNFPFYLSHEKNCRLKNI